MRRQWCGCNIRRKTQLSTYTFLVSRVSVAWYKSPRRVGKLLVDLLKNIQSVMHCCRQRNCWQIRRSKRIHVTEQQHMPWVVSSTEIQVFNFLIFNLLLLIPAPLDYFIFCVAQQHRVLWLFDHVNIMSADSKLWTIFYLSTNVHWRKFKYMP